MKKICMIVPYFGTFPNYFDFWLESCKANKDIDWLIFTDSSYTSNADNIKFYAINWNDFCSFVQEKFDFKVVLSSPYKLCDFRPAYGLIFHDFLKEYDFWGHCDVDLIFGNIRKFITEDILSNYDRILSYGHFSLYKNKESINSLFMDNKGIYYDYKYIYSKPENFAFDEDGIPQRNRIKELIMLCRGKSENKFSGRCSGGMKTLSIENNIRFYLGTPYDDIRQFRKSFFSTRDIVGYTAEESYKFPQLYAYDNGELLRYVWTPSGLDISESMYVHFQKRTMNIKVSRSSRFMVIPNSFVSYIEDVDYYKSLCEYKIFYPHYYKKLFNNVIKKIKRMLRW